MVGIVDPCPRCKRRGLLFEGSRVGNPPVVIERIKCPACGWVEGVDDADGD